jgi:predicted AAA+ superfamily ATPase
MRLKEIAESYLLRDILQLDKVKNSKLLIDLLRLLAYQIGKEVSLNELATQLGYDRKTIIRYLDLLEKSFVLINVRGFSRNLRKEISKKSKFYFYDNGIRNALISNYNDLDVRNDVGILWENFLFMERLKYRSYKNINANMYFWRTFDGKEIDLVEERDGKLFGYEFKYRDGKIKIPKDWVDTYSNASCEVINSENYLHFIGI